jgi:GxxExxY protein
LPQIHRINKFSEQKYPLQSETGRIIGLCMEIHKILGKGLQEIVYKDALELEFKTNNILFEREKEYKIVYKNTELKHKFYADFVVDSKIVLEVKCCNSFAEDHYSQVINYLAISKCTIGLIVNFGTDSLQIKRVIL